MAVGGSGPIKGPEGQPRRAALSITQQNIHFLRQGRALLDDVDQEVYARTGGIAGPRGSVGAHVRHCIDCYRCFLEGLETSRVDYDARGRDPRVEVEPAAAACVIDQLIERLEALEGSNVETPLQVRADAAAWRGSLLRWGSSTLGRELQFLLSHTVHHYALIAMLLRSHGIEPDPSFGVAPSTLSFHQVTSPAGR